MHVLWYLPRTYQKCYGPKWWPTQIIFGTRCWHGHMVLISCHMNPFLERSQMCQYWRNSEWDAGSWYWINVTFDPKAEVHIFVGVAEHSKAWKYYNKISRHVQTSRNITFDQNDTKLFPIPNEDDDDNPAPLEGETSTRKAAPEPLKDPDPITPLMSPAFIPNP